MARKAATKTALIHLCGAALLVALLAVFGNKRAFDPPVYTALVVGLLLAATVFGWWYEARKERQLDELELAGASFGARWAVAVLSIIVLLLLFATPLQDAIVLFAESYAENEGRPLPAPVGVFIMGFLFAMVIQMTATAALGAAWMWTKR